MTVVTIISTLQAMRLMVLVVVQLFAAGCGDNTPSVHSMTGPDAAVDAVPADGGAYVNSPCCAYLPDENAVRTCSGPFPDNSCGVIACKLADGTWHNVNFCGAMTDAGI